MPLDPAYIAAIDLLGAVCEEYRRKTGGDTAWLVGGASVVLMTDGAFMSGDFDLVAANDSLFEQILLAHGFHKETRAGMLQVGYFHPKHLDYGWQLVTGPLFDGATDVSRKIELRLRPDSIIVMPPYEDMIADRLAQYCMPGGQVHPELLAQARAIYRLAETIDEDYLVNVSPAKTVITLCCRTARMPVRRFEFSAFIKGIQERREVLARQGLVLPTDDEMRNTGLRRTPEKRALLQRLDESAEARGVTPVKRNY